MSLRRPTALLASLAFAACGPDDSTPGPDTDAPQHEETTSPEVDAPDDTDQADPEPWQHVGPITHAPAPEVQLPLFERQEIQLPEGLDLPEARAMVVDFDHDGRDDIVVLGTTEGMKPIFLRNTTEKGGPWTFEDFTEQSGIDVPMTLLVFGDIDNNGTIDAFSGTSFRSGADGVMGIWTNDGKGHFTYQGTAGIENPRHGLAYKEMAAATLADFDGDGILDLYIAMWNAGDLRDNLYYQTPDELYRGDGTGAFFLQPLPEQHNALTSEMDPSLSGLSRRGYGLCPADFDNDGDLDLFVNNYGAGRPALGDPPHYWEWNFLWRNDGAMAFVDVGEESEVHASVRGIESIQEESPVVFDGVTYPGPIGGNGFGCSWGDFNNDGHLDLVVGQIAHPDYPQSDRLLLHVNPGGEPGAARVFTEESHERGLEYHEDELHPVFVDINNDGRLDLAVSRLRGGSKWEVYLQDDDQHFNKQTWAESGVDVERPGPTLWLDVDQDGALDFFMPKGKDGRFYRNIGAQGNHLVIELIARAPRDATGARVSLKSSVGPQIREVIGGTGHYNSQQSRRQYFGLAGDSGAADVQIRWPDGEIQILGDVKANQHLRITQGGAIEIVP